MLQKTDIVNPFDPSLIDVDIAVVNMGYLLDLLKNGFIELQPDFQRASDLWSPRKKSRLIESILLGLPLPSFYFSEYVDSETKTVKYQVIDGQQRLCALREFFVLKTMRLQGLQFLKEYEEYGWDDLEMAAQMNFKSLKITINTLRKSTPAKVKYVIFQRVNTAGIPLTPQEMRWALNQGEATKLLRRMALDKNFRRVTCYSVPSKRMEDLDYANRFIAFYMDLQRYGSYESLDDFLNVNLERVNSMDAMQIQILEDAYSSSMRVCWEIFGNDAFRKRFHVGDRRRPLSKALFDAMSVNVAKLSESQKKVLVQRKEKIKIKMIELCNTQKFLNAISTGTGNAQAVSTRFSMLNEEIKKILENA
jgi:hypothetical protein